ncbi:MAG TPA: hypothetical protein VK427_08600, partial [Kofleriaceae bacterium]|nr:hypothetical protein [Kofleriaceae bacterium]
MLDLADLGLDEGAHLLIERALAREATIVVTGTAETLAVDLPAWLRTRGHRLGETLDRVATSDARRTFIIHRGSANRWVGAERAGSVHEPAALARARWGLAARGALVEAGAPPLDLALAERRV